MSENSCSCVYRLTCLAAAHIINDLNSTTFYVLTLILKSILNQWFFILVDMTEYLDEILELNRKLGFRDSSRYFQLQVKDYQKVSESKKNENTFKSEMERYENDKQITGEYLKNSNSFNMNAGLNIFGIKIGAGYGRQTSKEQMQESSGINESSTKTRVAIVRIRYVHYVRKFRVNVALGKRSVFYNNIHGRGRGKKLRNFLWETINLEKKFNEWKFPCLTVRLTDSQ